MPVSPAKIAPHAISIDFGSPIEPLGLAQAVLWVSHILMKNCRKRAEQARFARRVLNFLDGRVVRDERNEALAA